MRDRELLGFAKALTYFNPRLIELQKEYARQLLTHRNPYTGNEYRHEPAVAIVELVNENSIVESWFSGRLLGKNQQKNPGTWTDIPATLRAGVDRPVQPMADEERAGRRAGAAPRGGRREGRTGSAADAGRVRPAPAERFRTEA